MDALVINIINQDFISRKITRPKYIYIYIYIIGRNRGPAKTIFGQKSGPAMAGPAVPPTTALSNCFKKTYLIISVTKEVVQTFVFEARERFKFKSVFMLLFFCVCVFLYGMGHFLSTTKIQNYYLTLAIKKNKIYCYFQSCMKNAISIRNT